MPNYELNPIGKICRDGGQLRVEIDKAYRDGLQQLEHFSHVIVLWWADKMDTPEKRAYLQTEPPYAPDKTTGVFAMRSEYRPNPIGLTVCAILKVDKETGIVSVKNIDAFDGTPVLDLKGYFPVVDRVNGATIPNWIPNWGDSLPAEGMGLWEEETE